MTKEILKTWKKLTKLKRKRKRRPCKKPVRRKKFSFKKTRVFAISFETINAGTEKRGRGAHSTTLSTAKTL